MAALVLKYCFQKLELWKSDRILNLQRRSNICLEAGNNLRASGPGMSIAELKGTYKIKCTPLHWTHQAIKKNCTLFLVLSISPVLLVCVNGEKIQLRMSNLIFVNSSSPPLSMDCQVCLCTVLAAVIAKSMDLPKGGCTLGERVGIWGELYLSRPP